MPSSALQVSIFGASRDESCAVLSLPLSGFVVCIIFVVGRWLPFLFHGVLPGDGNTSLEVRLMDVCHPR